MSHHGNEEYMRDQMTIKPKAGPYAPSDLERHIQEHQERAKEIGIIQQIKRWQGQQQSQEMADAVGVLGGGSKVVTFVCDECERGRVTTRVRICGPIHYWKQKKCSACRGQGYYRFVQTERGTRGHAVWEKPGEMSQYPMGVGVEGGYASGLAGSGSAKPIGFRPQAITSLPSPPPGQIVGLDTKYLRQT